jgi:hypothetical protein
VRTGHKTQGVSLFTRMGDRFSTWDVSNGLQSIIPTLLTSGLLGYPFCLPDMIGGNAYFGQRPSHELMVRWTQVNALMPAMQFSIAPWDLSPETACLCAAALQLRKKVGPPPSWPSPSYPHSLPEGDQPLCLGALLCCLQHRVLLQAPPWTHHDL